MIEHSAECQAAFAQHDRDVATWTKKFQKYCRHCAGWGGFHYAGNHAEPDGYYECEKCGGKCPRCSETLPDDFYDNAQVCKGCGLISDQPDGIPQGPECLCDDFIDHTGPWPAI